MFISIKTNQNILKEMWSFFGETNNVNIIRVLIKIKFKNTIK